MLPFGFVGMHFPRGRTLDRDDIVHKHSNVQAASATVFPRTGWRCIFARNRSLADSVHRSRRFLLDRRFLWPNAPSKDCCTDYERKLLHL